MDKQEYKIRNDEIKSLIKQREFKRAVEIADTIDWTKVQSVMTLCSISDLYKVNRRYPEAKVLLQQAYDRNPNGRQIVYSLCELSIRMGEVVPAIEYYKQYSQQWPMDNGKFILQYKIYEAQDVTIEERIAVLEELKKRDYIPKWGYELANLYHRMGLATKCVEECDELIIWFGDGPYVKKAMELKMLHQQLTENQMDIYQSMLPPGQQTVPMQQSQVTMSAPAPSSSGEDDIMVKTMDMGQYNTINLQRELAESMKDVLVADNGFAPLVEAIEPSPREQLTQELAVQDVLEQLSKPIEEDRGYNNPVTQSIIAPMMQNTVQMQDTGEMEELFFDDGNRSTEEMKLSALQELHTQENQEKNIPRSIYNDSKFNTEPEMPQYDPVRELELTMVYDSPMVPEDVLNPAVQENIEEEVKEEPVSVPTQNTANMGSTRVFTKKDLDAINSAVVREVPREDIGDRDKEELMRIIDEKVQEALNNAFNSERIYASTQAQMATSQISASQIANNVMDSMLSQEYDGQISMVLPSANPVEKQITGQLSINDLLGEWENTKKHSQEQIVAETSQMVLEKTGPLFTEFEAKTRDSILEQLEKEAALESSQASEEEVEDVEEVEENNDTVTEEETEVAEESVAEEDDSVEEIEDEPADDSESEDEIEESDEDENEESDEDEDEESDEGEDEESDEDEDEESDEDEDEESDEDEDKESDEDEDEESDEDEDEESDEQAGAVDRSMTEDELALFGQFAQTRRARQKLLWALDQVSLASYTGNIYVTGDTPEESLELSKNVVRYIQSTDHNFSGKIAKVTGVSLNNKSVSVMVDKLANGGLIIEKASGMSAETTKNLIKALNQQNKGIVVVLQDSKKHMRKMLDHFDGMKQIFNVHIEVEELSDDALVAYGKKYAEHLEYSIDDMGILALHTRIDAMQTSDHIVTVSDVRDIVDEAIANANRKSFKHFTDVLLSKRYDDEDMIILRERDFTE